MVNYSFSAMKLKKRKIISQENCTESNNCLTYSVGNNFHLTVSNFESKIKKLGKHVTHHKIPYHIKRIQLSV